MARPRQRDLLSRLADAGEEAIQKLADVPGTDRFMGAVTSLRDRMDEMQKRMRGLDELERRLTVLEKRVEGMGGSSTRSRSSSASPSGSRAKSRPSTSSSSTSRTRKTSTTKKSGSTSKKKS
jgi:hypothetical protein